MKYRYDLHIHSALSPCAEEEMTPVTIVGQAALSGLDFVAIADHNAIGHVPLALRAGEEFGVSGGARRRGADERGHTSAVHVPHLRGSGGVLRAHPRVGEEEQGGSVRRAALLRRGRQRHRARGEDAAGQRGDLLRRREASWRSPSGGVAVPAHIDRDANSMLNDAGRSARGVSGGGALVEGFGGGAEEWSGERTRHRGQRRAHPGRRCPTRER